jgi:hypothetical protein
MGPVFWIARDADGEVRAGCGGWIDVLTPRGWERVSGAVDPAIGLENACEALGALCVRCHDARLMHCDVDDRDPWPDAPGPWRMEVPYRVLWSEEDEAA